MSVTAASLARRRAQEKIVRERQDFLVDECKATYVAQWEERTSVRIEKQDLLNRADRFAELDKQSLTQRQAHIKELYEKDESKWELNLKQLQYVSTDDRMNQIRDKAIRLKEKREKERQDFVNECYARQWRDGCDELRALNAKAVTAKVMRDRTYAFDTKIGNKPKEDIEDTKRSKEKEVEIKQNEEKTKLKVMQKNFETKTALDSQVEHFRQKNELLNEQKRIEEREKMEEWKKIDEMKREKELQARRDARLRGEEILNENSRRVQKREKDVAVQRKQDLVLLEYALRQERQDIEKEEKQKNQGKETAKEYLTFLSDQMIQEKMDDEAVEDARNAEMERILTKREQKIHDKNDLKKRLTSEVHASRLEQIRIKEELLKKEKEELAKQVKINLLEWDRQGQVEREKSLIKKEATVKNMLANKAVTEEKAKQKTKENQDDLLLQRQLLNSEKNHMERVQRDAGNMVTHFPRKTSKMFS